MFAKTLMAARSYSLSCFRSWRICFYRQKCEEENYKKGKFLDCGHRPENLEEDDGGDTGAGTIIIRRSNRSGVLTSHFGMSKNFGIEPIRQTDAHHADAGTCNDVLKIVALVVHSEDARSRS